MSKFSTPQSASSTWIKATFILDAFEEVFFEGYTRGETWNGFECPYFPFESAQFLMDILSNANQTAFYDTGADEFVCAEEDETDDHHRFGAVQVETIGRVYPVGAFMWMWERADLVVSNDRGSKPQMTTGVNL